MDSWIGPSTNTLAKYGAVLIIAVAGGAIVSSYVLGGGFEPADSEYRLQLDEDPNTAERENVTITDFGNLTEPQQREFRSALHSGTVVSDSQPELTPYASPSTLIRYNDTLYDVILSVGH